MTVVLLVDDEPDVIDALKLALRSAAYVVVGETCPLRALALLEERRVDVVVADERMPAMSGSEFLARAYVRQPDAVRIVLTGCGNFESAIEAINQGQIARYLRKPCPGEELVRNIENALLEHKARAHPKLEPERRAADQPTHALLGLSESERGALSDREREVLAWLVDGLRVGQIAKRLHLSAHTVRNHLKTLYRKIDLHSQSELIDHARGTTSD